MKSRQHKKYYGGYVPFGKEPSIMQREQVSLKFLAGYHQRKKSFTFAPPVDWRNHNGENFISLVKNQGACLSCVAFSAVAVAESMLKIKNGPETGALLSEAHLFYCIAWNQGKTCLTGWSMQPAQQAFQNVGVCDAACYPYTDVQENCAHLCPDWQNRLTKTTGYVELQDPDAIRYHLLTTGPVQTGFNVYADFYSYKNGIYRQDPAAKFQESHALCMIGYDDDSEYWICKNSWGDGWGQQGFCQIAYGQCGIDAYALGVTGMA